MRKLLLTAATIAAVSTAPTVALAQDNAATGTAVGAGTGFLLGGPPGAIIGGIIGGTLGATTEPRVYVEPNMYDDEPRTRTRVIVEPEATRVCWNDEFGRRLCDWR